MQTAQYILVTDSLGNVQRIPLAKPALAVNTLFVRTEHAVWALADSTM